MSKIISYYIVVPNFLTVFAQRGKPNRNWVRAWGRLGAGWGPKKLTEGVSDRVLQLFILVVSDSFSYSQNNGVGIHSIPLVLTTVWIFFTSMDFARFWPVGVRGLILAGYTLNWSSSEFCHGAIAVLNKKIGRLVDELWPIFGRPADRFWNFKFSNGLIPYF